MGECLSKDISRLGESCKKSIYSLKLNKLGHHPEKYLLFILHSFMIFGGVFGIAYIAKIETNFKTLATDFTFFSFDILIVRLVTVFLIMSLLKVMLIVLPASFFIAAEKATVWLPKNNIIAFLTYILMVDFFGYITHRIMHTKYFWKFHATHHSSTDLQWHSNFRNHPVNAIIQSMVITLPLIILGLNKITYVFLLSYMILFDAFTHSSIGLRTTCPKPLRFLKYIFVTPRFHRHHHQQNPGRNQNYAGIFSFWDLIFKTSCFEINDKELSGVNNSYPQNFKELLIKPFRKNNE